ncbi:MAG: hypothetical protein QME60_00370 [Verrucomicrobiota bacterium]|nr:hypothetical protein [Verrucomicrobiota bacterium]
MITLITTGHALHEIGVKSLVAYLEDSQVPVQAICLDHPCRP